MENPEEVQSTISTTTASIYKQLALTLKALDTELAKTNADDMRLEYFFNKIKILEAHL